MSECCLKNDGKLSGTGLANVSVRVVELGLEKYSRNTAMEWRRGWGGINEGGVY